jgi:hypothetical protein
LCAGETDDWGAREEDLSNVCGDWFQVQATHDWRPIVAVTDAALEVTQDEDQAYEIASLVLMKLLQASASETAEHLLAACDDKLIH